MVKLVEHKRTTERSAIKMLPVAGRVCLPLSQHIGKVCVAEVKPGDRVLMGQRIAFSDAKVFSPVHASVSGVVVSVEEWPHPLLGRCKAVIIDNDGKDIPAFGGGRSDKEVKGLSPDEIRRAVFDAGVVGMGGASFPTHIKLTPPKPLTTLIVNGAECEPYLTGDDRLMVENTDGILKGIALSMQCTHAAQVFIAVEENKPEAIKALTRELRGTPYQLKVLPSQYPQGGEKQLVKNVLGKEISPGKLPFDLGVLVQNVATLYAMYEAVYFHKPLFERVVTVSGDCVAHPGNYRVRLGTMFSELIAQCGPLDQEPHTVIVGGPMMGVAQFSLEAPVIKNTNGLLVLSKGHYTPRVNADCVRCGRCVAECPVGIMPCMVSMAAEKERWDLAKAYGCFDCIECGICNYVCPQKRNIVQAIKQAKVRAPK